MSGDPSPRPITIETPIWSGRDDAGHKCRISDVNIVYYSLKKQRPYATRDDVGQKANGDDKAALGCSTFRAHDIWKTK